MSDGNVAGEFVKSLPPASVSIATFAGFSLQEWVYIATIGYILLQSAFLVYRWVKRHKNGK